MIYSGIKFEEQSQSLDTSLLSKRVQFNIWWRTPVLHMVRNSIEALIKATEGQSYQRSSLADCRRTVSELNNANSFYVGI